MWLALVISLGSGVAIGSALSDGSAPLFRRSGVASQLWAQAQAGSVTIPTEWESVPGLGAIPVCVRGGLTADVSLDVTSVSDPVAVRLLVDRQEADPGTVGFLTGVSAASRDSGSFVFTKKVRRGLHELRVEWRSDTAHEAVLNGGNVRVLYRPQDGCA